MVNTIVEQIDSLFHPKTIAAFGVSSKGGKLGNLLLQSFIDIGFEGTLVPVHPEAKEIMGLKSYPNLKSYGPIDLAIIALHPAKVFDAVKDCVENGKAKGIIIFSSGFSERGNEGKRLQEDIVNYAKSHGTRIIGPNCMGIYAPSSKLSIFPGLPREPGVVSFLSQSGSLAVQIIAAAFINGIKFSKAISFGNSADLDLSDFLDYSGWDQETKVIACYVEGIKDGNRFIKKAKEVSKKKPIIIWKVGETPGGRRAAHSHTGSISGSVNLWDQVLDQVGILRISNVRELLGHLGAFINPYFPKGNHIAIISGPGGPAVSSADACEKSGLQLASLGSETQNALAQILPEFGTSVQNPVDLSLAIAFDPELNYKAAAIVGKDPNVDILLIYVSVLQKTVVKGMVEIQKQIKKPIALVATFDPTSAMPGGDRIKNLFQPINPKQAPQLLEMLYQNGISFHLTETDAAKALAALWKYSNYIQNSK
ncbi:MAG: CoA-binding protein [Promethearchaeota archaeon]